MPAVLALQERFNFTSHAESPPLFYIHFFILRADPIIRDEILEIFNEFTREEDHTVLLSSHIISDLEKISDYIAFLHQGKLLFCEEKDRLLEKYGILQVTEEDEKDVPKEAIAGRKQGKYATELLVKRSKISDAFEIERAGIEDIVLFLARKGE